MHCPSRAITWTYQQAPAAPWQELLFTAAQTWYGTVRRSWPLLPMSKRKTPTSSSEPTLTLISEQRPLAEQRRLDGTIGRVRVTIELLDDTLLTGWLEEADGQMKCARPPPHPTAVCAVLT